MRMPLASVIHLLSWQSLAVGVAGRVFTGFSLINAASDKVIGPLRNGSVVNLSQTGSSLNLVALTSSTTSIAAVLFDLDKGRLQSKERVPPYSLGGDSTGDYSPTPLLARLGNHSLKVTAVNQLGKVVDLSIVAFAVISSPIRAPVPVPVPVRLPVRVPVPAPRPVPVPVPVAAPIPISFQSIYINSGGPAYTDVDGNFWEADNNHSYFIGGYTTYKAGNIRGTSDPTLFYTDRSGNFSYKIPVPSGNYQVTLRFVETLYEGSGARLFRILFEGTVTFDAVDIYDQAGPFTLTLTNVVPVTDGALDITFVTQNNADAKVNAIAVQLNGPHLAHSVPGGPYYAVDVDGRGNASLLVDGSQSHTHAPGKVLVDWTWKVGFDTVGTREMTTIVLPVGEHDLRLAVTDSSGNKDILDTKATVLPQGYPFISALSPAQGDIAGGQNVTLYGSGFNYSSAEIVVHFGDVDLTGPSVTVIKATQVTVTSPVFVIGIPVMVSVTTKIGTSNNVTYTYNSGSPIDFVGKVVTTLSGGPSSLAFGPDGNLYIGTAYTGTLYKLRLDENHTMIDSIVSQVIGTSEPPFTRSILGIAFDPRDVSQNPAIYVSHSTLFHGSNESCRGLGINGKISKVSGANLDTLQHVITGLPVSDHDHAVNGLAFSDQGDLYIQVGGNTNAGVPGALSSSGTLDENVLSAATLVARLSQPSFDGNLTFDVNCNLNPGKGVQVYASGFRNPFDLVWHSNGQLYGTDNGPNKGYGAKSTGCSTQAPDPIQADKLVHILPGRYYGHANRKRGQSDPRQCVWRPFDSVDDGYFKQPMTLLPSSSDGIIEYQTEHFGGQLRRNLIISKYKGPLFRVILNDNGTDALYDPFLIVPDGGLDVTQGPDGSLFVTQFDQGTIKSYQALEVPSSVLKVKSTWPRRGPVTGKFNFSVYGDQLAVSGQPTVRVGGRICPLLTWSSSKIICTLPASSRAGHVDVSVSSGVAKSTMVQGFRYI